VADEIYEEVKDWIIKYLINEPEKISKKRKSNNFTRCPIARINKGIS